MEGPDEHAAAEPAQEEEEEDLSKLTVVKLRARLSALGEPTSGRKADLIERLKSKKQPREEKEDEVVSGESELKRVKVEPVEEAAAPEEPVNEAPEAMEVSDPEYEEEREEEQVVEEEPAAAPVAADPPVVEEEAAAAALVVKKEEPEPEPEPEAPLIVAEDQPAEASASGRRRRKKKDDADDYQLPPPEEGVLPYLAVVPNVGKLDKHKRLVSVDPWAFASWNQILDWVAQDGSVPLQHKRPLYRAVLELYPTAGRIWKDLCEAEIASGKAELVEEYFTSSLLVCRYVPLWCCYLRYMSTREHNSLITAREEAITAFEFAAKHMGLDTEAAPIWELYLRYLKDMSCGNVYEESSRMATIRRVYHRAIAVPMEGLEGLWKAYQSWEQSVDAKLASEITQKLASVYTNARVKCRERSGYTRGLRRHQLAVPPTESGDMPHQVLLWKRLLLYEKCDSLKDSDPLVYLQNLRGTFDSCLTVLRFYPEVWMDYAETVRSVLQPQGADVALKEARDIWVRAMEALPGSPLIHFEYSLLLESQMQVDDAANIYQMMLQREAFSQKQKQLVLIHELLFVRRTRGMQEARRHSVKALKSPYASWELYVVAARIELFMNRELVPARKLFEHGMSEYGKHVPYLLQFIDALYSMNEEGNMRVLFDSFMRDDDLRFNRELWDEYLRFELTYGNRKTVDLVAKRRATALGNAVDPNGIFGVINRAKVLDLFPAAPQEIRAMALGVNVMLRDGTRGDADEADGGPSKRAALRKSDMAMTRAERGGNPLSVLFRDPPALAALPRPQLAGEGCGLIQYTREMAVGAALPGEAGAVVPAALLDLISALPAAHEYTGPVPSPDMVLDLLRAVELPGPPEEDNGAMAQMQRRMPQRDGGIISNAPSASDIFRLRQLLKNK